MSLKKRRSLLVAFALVFALVTAAVPHVLAQPAASVTLNFATLTIPVGSGRQFIATVTGVANTAVTWSVNGVPGGSSTTGTIDSNGNFLSPAGIPAGTVLKISAT